MEYKERLLNELIQLTDRIARLDNYLNGSEVNDKERQELMYKQLEAMSVYREVLIKRVLLEMN